MQFPRKVRRSPVINIINLIDVLVVLLIFYIATTVFKKSEPKIIIKVPNSLTATTTQDRFRASSEKVLAYVNRAHNTAFELLTAVGQAGASLTYSVADSSGLEAQLTWSRDPMVEPTRPIPESTELAAGRTPSGYPYAVHLAPAGELVE